VNRHSASAPIWIAGAGLFGYCISIVPSPAQPGVFWVSNLSSPWLALAFFAGTSQRTVRGGALAGALADIACVVGFYLHFLLLDDSAGPRGHGSALVTRLADNFSHWAAFISPWIVFAVVGGALFGVLGLRWRQRRSMAAGIALGAAFAFEPVAWYVRNGSFESPVVIWLVELMFGLLVMALMFLYLRRSGGSCLPTE
jgi:hypothetical protein